MLIAFFIFAVVFLLCLVGLLVYLYPGSRKVSTVPGMDPSDAKDGNTSDIARAGGMHNFLLALHEEYGPIASFWLGPQLVVSIASPNLFSQHSHVFDRPVIFFKPFEPLISPHSLQFANGAEGQKRRRQYDSCFSHEAVGQVVPDFVEIAEGVAKKWKTMQDDQHIPLGQHMATLAVNGIVRFAFGDYIKSDEDIALIRRNYEKCWADMESTLTEGPLIEGTQKHKDFSAALAAIRGEVLQLLAMCRKNSKTKQGRNYFIDRLLDYVDSEDHIVADAITYFVGGYHTTGYTLTWCLYFLASHPEIQEKAFKSIKHDLGEEKLDSENVFRLEYLKRCVNETFRCAVIAPFAARVQNFDSELGGHKIPKDTPIIHALGVVLKDPALWPNPNVFDPDRFTSENEQARPPMAFQPFGFAGKRKCPGYRLAMCEVLTYLAVLLTSYKISLVPGQVVTPVYGLVAKPEDEIWITVKQRKAH